MASTPCTIDWITLTSVLNGSMYQDACDSEGNELPNIPTTLTTEPNCRFYYCGNCNRKFDGSETFEEVVKHLGTFPQKTQGYDPWKQ